MKDYHIDLFWSDEDDCYVANLPDFEYCSAFGDTPEEALAEILVAKEGWLETARELGKLIPEARYVASRLTKPRSDPVPMAGRALKDYHINVFWSDEDDLLRRRPPRLGRLRGVRRHAAGGAG